MILPEVRDPRLITVRRGGLLTEEDHTLLALWAADCASHVLHLFEQQVPADHRPRDAILAARAWAAGDLGMMQARAVGGHAMGAARALKGTARFAAYAAGQAACVGHVPEHDLGAAAYAIKAAQAARTHDPGARLAERDWQRARVPEHLSALMIEDQARRNDICWSVFDD
ncbi:putative immunity protein [Ornithinimicrobium sp. LYQ92]|uniref:putative immunity protein n=1 Tax=Serinicoccus sp. LYQ92 TaxID=3378798 RepID=UPI003851C610